jgi:hypothetical protein
LFAGNHAATEGAGIYKDGDSLLQLVHLTIVSPTLASNQAVSVGAGTVYITNTIVASHTTGIENAGGTVSEDYSLFYGNTANLSGVTGGSHSLTGDPAFVNPAADDYHLKVTSAAIDAGTDAGVTTDFDGKARPQGAGYDIGAYEYEPINARINGTDCNLIDAITAANTDTATGACAAGTPGADTITLLSDVTLGAVNNAGTNGDNGLPVIASVITLEGAGYTISRAVGAPEFRFFEVNATGVLTLTAATVSGGKVSNSLNEGGALRNGGRVTVNRLTFSGNMGKYGGGIFNGTFGILSVNESTFTDNIATDGGGILNQGAVDVINSTLSGNSTDDGGGLSNNGDATVINTTIVSNTAGGGGGGIVNYSALTLMRSLVAGNSASYGREVYNFDSITSDGYNLFGHSGETSAQAFVGDFTPDATDLVATSDGGGTPTALAAILGPLADNGGPSAGSGQATWTHALVAGSPAIDAAPDGPATDQRGELRNDLRCDIGAFELHYADSPTVIQPMSSITLTTFGPALVGLMRDAGYTNPGVVTVTKSTHWTITPTNGILVKWGITPTATSGFSLTLQLCYTTTELNGQIEGNLRFWRSSGGTLVQIGGTPTFSTVNGLHCATLSGITELSSWTLATDIPTAVRLRDLTATANTPSGMIGALGAALAALGVVLIGRRRLKVR